MVIGRTDADPRAPIVWPPDMKSWLKTTLMLGKLWRRQWYPSPVLLPGKSHGRRSLVGCSSLGPQKDRTEQLHFHFSLSCIGEGNGNPLQYSCLENPRDGEPGGLTSMGSRRVGHYWSDLAAAAAGKIEGRWRCYRIRQWDGMIETMDMSLSKFWEIVWDREAWHAAVHGVTKNQTGLSNWTTTTNLV